MLLHSIYPWLRYRHGTLLSDIVPMLARMVTSNDDAALVLAKMVEHVPSIAQLGVQLGDNER